MASIPGQRWPLPSLARSQTTYGSVAYAKKLKIENWSVRCINLIGADLRAARRGNGHLGDAALPTCRARRVRQDLGTAKTSYL